MRPGEIAIDPEWVTNAVRGLEKSMTGQPALQATTSGARYKAVS